MALNETALETLGLAPLWVRRGMGGGAHTAESVVAEVRPLSEPIDVAPAAASAQAVGTQAAATRGEAGMSKKAAAPATAAADSGMPPAPAAAASTIDTAHVEHAAPRAAERAPLRAVEDDADAFGIIDAFDALDPFDAPPAAPSARRGNAAVSAAPIAAPVVDMREAKSDVHALGWDELEARVTACERCRLCEKRTQTVFGVGDREADWMLIGEAPGENEDKQGEPFVGQAGKLLDSMLRALSLARGQDVYIANVVKCRPPGNRNPEPDEVARCEPYLQRQVALVKPKLIIALGRVAAQNLLKTDASISSLRGRVHRYEDVPVIVTYHPAYLLRSLPDKAKAWADLCLAVDTYRQALAGQAGQ